MGQTRGGGRDVGEEDRLAGETWGACARHGVGQGCAEYVTTENIKSWFFIKTNKNGLGGGGEILDWRKEGKGVEGSVGLMAQSPTRGF